VIPPNVPKTLWERGGDGSLGIIDGNGSVCRGFYALPDVPMAGLTELRNDVERLRAAQFERIVVIFDALDRTQDHRLALDPEYKANRRDRPKPEGLRRQLFAARELCEAIRVQYDCDSSVEADDLIAWHVVRSMDVATAVTILTLDKDLSMLVGEFGRTNVACWTAGGGVVDPSAVEIKWGVPPTHLVALFSLMGDSSDGVRGVDGIGQTLGSRIVMAHGQLPEILAAARAGLVEPERIRKRLLEQEARAWLSRDLIALRPDLVGAPRVAIVGDVVTSGGDAKALYDWRWLSARGLT
jgi:DNA polymerase-1